MVLTCVDNLVLEFKHILKILSHYYSPSSLIQARLDGDASSSGDSDTRVRLRWVKGHRRK